MKHQRAHITMHVIPWFLILVTMPLVRQSTLLGRSPSWKSAGTCGDLSTRRPCCEAQDLKHPDETASSQAGAGRPCLLAGCNQNVEAVSHGRKPWLLRNSAAVRSENWFRDCFQVCVRLALCAMAASRLSCHGHPRKGLLLQDIRASNMLRRRSSSVLL